MYVDGRPTPIGTLMSAARLVIGSVIDTVAPAPAGESGIILTQAAGEGGGNRQSLAPGRYSLGTARRANVAPLTFNEVLVPRCQLAVEHSGRVTVAASQGDVDGYSAVNPARWTDEHLRIGHRVFRLEDAIDDRATSLVPTSMGRLSFLRRSRLEQLDLPEPDVRAGNARRLLRRRRSPGSDVPERRDATKDPAEVAFDAELAGTRRAHLDVAEVVRRAIRLSDHLWERRPVDEDAYVFSVGLADQARADVDPAHAHRRDLAVLPSAPVVVDLANERGIGFAGTPPQTRAAVRALVLQACVLHSPADLDVVVLTTRSGAARWEWIKWLPHARGSRGAQLFTDDDTIGDWVAAQRTLSSVVAGIRPLGRSITPNRLTLAVVDDPALWRGRAAMLRGLFAEAQLPVRFVALSDRADDLPAVCTTVVRIATNGATEVEYMIAGQTIADVVPLVLELELALTAARKLSPLEDQYAQSSTKTLLPALVSLESLLDPDGLDAHRVAERWGAARRNGAPRIPLGLWEAGLVDLELSDDGPHVLVVGAARSGKTGLLRSIILSLMATLDPAALNVLCIEPSDGSSFDVFATASHLVGAVDEIDEHSGVRALRSLRSEVNRRVQLLAEHRAATLDEYNGLAGAPAIPRLAIVVDDAPEVMARGSTFLPQLIDLVDHSRHVGLHLIVSATHVPGPIESSLKALANVRIALRMTDAGEATALMGTRQPVQISSNTPGRGSFRTGDAEAITVQFASPTTASSDLIEVTPFVVARDLSAVERKITVRSGEQGGLGTMRLLVDVVVKAAVQNGHRSPGRIVCPDLPTSLLYEDLPSDDVGAAEECGAAFAVSDLPDDHTQSIRRWSPDRDGNMLVIGGSAKERSGTLATLLMAASARYPADRLHFYVVDSAPGQHSSLHPLESLPACGAVATPDDFDRMLRVLVHIDAEVQRRSAGAPHPSDPHIVLVVNDVGSLMRGLELDGEFEHGSDLVERIVGNGSANGITALDDLPERTRRPGTHDE